MLYRVLPDAKKQNGQTKCLQSDANDIAPLKRSIIVYFIPKHSTLQRMPYTTLVGERDSHPLRVPP